MRIGRTLTLLMAIVCAACSVAPVTGARTWLDERTTVTVTAQEPPLVLAREDHIRAANARDYASLRAVELNRMGKRSYALVIFAWSTIDRTAAERATMEAAFARVALWADDRPVELTRSTTETVSLTAELATASAVELWYPVTLDELRALADALTLALETHTTNEPRYVEWDRRQPGFGGFLEYIRHPH